MPKQKMGLDEILEKVRGQFWIKGHKWIREADGRSYSEYQKEMAEDITQAHSAIIQHIKDIIPKREPFMPDKPKYWTTGWNQAIDELLRRLDEKEND